MPISESQARNIASVLTEALPYIQRFHGSTVVVKYGGNAMVDETLKTTFARDVVLLKLVGLNPIVVHGGGPQIGELLDRLNIPTRFVNGMRVTDAETMDVVEMVLGGLVNQDIVSLINKNGGRAVGITGKDGDLIRARRLALSSTAAELAPSEIIDIGHVGEVESVNPSVLDALVRSNFIPVIAPIGVDADGVTHNVNADEAAGAVARALNAEKLILLTDVEGVNDGGGRLLQSLAVSEARKLIDEGAIQGGMIPKVECCIDALRGGVHRAHVVDGRILHAVLLEIFTDGGVGTLLTL